MLASRVIRLLPSRLRRPLSTSQVTLSGHNKWSKIKQKKGANDLQKGAIYAKANRDIVLAVRTGGSTDPEVNTILAAALKRAKLQGVPKENIEKALKKASGGGGKGNQQVTYEAMAASSVGIMIECLTDNINRTLPLIRDILSDHGARFAPVGFLFQRKGCVRVSLEKGEAFDDRLESLIETALEAEAEDFEQVESSEDAAEIEFTCPPNALAKLTVATTSTPGINSELISSELIYAPVEQGQTPDEQTEGKVATLIEALESNEDTLRVWTTLD